LALGSYLASLAPIRFIIADYSRAVLLGFFHIDMPCRNLEHNNVCECHGPKGSYESIGTLITA